MARQETKTKQDTDPWRGQESPSPSSLLSHFFRCTQQTLFGERTNLISRFGLYGEQKQNQNDDRS